MISTKIWTNVLAVVAICVVHSQLITAKDAQAQAWPNQPPGFQQLTSWPFTTPSGSGWATNGYNGSSFTDASAPISPPAGLHNYRDNSSNHGGNLYYSLSPARKEFFFAFAVKLSNPHYGWFNWYQKISIIDNAGQHMYLWATMENSNTAVRFELMDECGRAWCNSHLTSGPGTAFINNMGNPTFANGTWHKVEIYYKGSTGTNTQDGILKMWVDNTALLNRNTVNLNSNAADVFLTNVWDSINTALPQQEWVNYDHAYISVLGTTSESPSALPPPPAAPINLTVSTP